MHRHPSTTRPYTTSLPPLPDILSSFSSRLSVLKVLPLPGPPSHFAGAGSAATQVPPHFFFSLFQIPGTTFLSSDRSPLLIVELFSLGLIPDELCFFLVHFYSCRRVASACLLSDYEHALPAHFSFSFFVSVR